MINSDTHIEVAKVLKPQGIRGELKLLPFSSNPQDLGRFGSFCLARDGAILGEFRVEAFRATAQYAVLKLASLNDRNQAEAYRDCTLLVSRAEMPAARAGEYFIRDLLGLQVVSEQGELLGTLTDVLELPANDVYQIQKGDRELLIPAIADVVLDVQLEKRMMIVRLLEGLLDSQTE